MSTKKKTLFLAQFSMLLALEAIVCFTPLGSLPIGPMVATLMHIPVVVAAILLGTGAGAAMGGFAGLFSFIVWTFFPPPTSAAFAFVFTPFYSVGDYRGNFWSLVICFVPRILIGVVAALCYKGLSRMSEKKGRRDIAASLLGGALGSLANTFGVLGGVYLFFGREYAGVLGVAYSALLGLLGVTVATNGLLEMAIAAVVAAAVCPPLKKILNRGSV